MKGWKVMFGVTVTMETVFLFSILRIVFQIKLSNPCLDLI